MSGNTSWAVHSKEICKYEISDPSGLLYTADEYERRMFQAAAEVSAELQNYTVSYEVDNVGLGIDPDPETSIDDGRDMTFIVLVGLKAACTIQNERYQEDLGNAIKIRDGDSSIDTSVRAGAREAAIKSKWSVCSRYYDLLNRINADAFADAASEYGRFITGPEWEGQEGRWVNQGGYRTYVTRARNGGGDDRRR